LLHFEKLSVGLLTSEYLAHIKMPKYVDAKNMFCVIKIVK